MTTASKPRSTTGIGSLPHHNIDAALDYSFRMGIPFLPQIPIRNPWEFMLAQALEGLPGLTVERDGSVTLNIDIWHSRAHDLNNRLNHAFSTTTSTFEFEPSAAVSSTWQSFMWELQERKSSRAKIQIAGPMTCQWGLRLKDGTPIDRYPDVATQIYRLVMARALAMARKLKTAGIQPILYLDEPGLYGLSLSNPKHVLGLQELKLMVQALKKDGITVGLHCCSDTNWQTILDLDLDILSVDTALSLSGLLHSSHIEKVEHFITHGGRLSLGVIPTDRSSVLRSLDVEILLERLLDAFAKAWGDRPHLVKKVLSEGIYTPACGLALHSTADAELVLELLDEFHDLCVGALK